ncbi:MAG: flagellar hook-length control protein FliK [Agathobacter sp.]|nr:flagellar hook-length control protein FliK [Agathobacter sp.]
MQISDLARQYQNTTASTEAMNGTRGVEKLVSSVRELAAGNIFEGTVNSIQGGRVILGLSNGTELAARLDANMQLVRGQSMFFQVKSNNGETIAIRPYTVDGAGVNLTLLNALKAANLPVSERYLNMANSMMQEHMPIDKNSMSQMARILMANPDMSVNTLVQMKKLDIPITTEMVSQFENYMDDSNAVHKALDTFISELPSTMAGKDMPIEQLKAFDSQLLSIIADGMEESVSAGNVETQQNTAVLDQMVSSEQGMQDAAVGQQVSSEQAVGAEAGAKTENAVITEQMNIVEDGAENLQNAVNQSDTVSTNPATTKVITLLHNLFGETGIKAEDSSATLLNKLSNFILNGENVSKEALNELFSSKDMQQFLRDTLESQMYLKPQDVADGDKVKKLYERLETKTQSLESLLMNAGLKDTPLAQTVANVQGNVDFMNQLNQTYTYVQIPLKMSGQNASGQLYVYTNKKDLADPERDLTAFLHLDMDNLGSTDVSVRMHRKDVDTKFYMDSDEAYALVKAHMPELEERLRNKGFNAKVYVENEGKKVNFVDDFLKKDAPSTGQLHRYSFDVRA